MRSRARTREASIRPPAARSWAFRTELALALVLSILATAILFGPHVIDGGRHLDDWWLGMTVRFPHSLGFSSAYDYLNVNSGPRPGAIAWWLVTYKLLGIHDVWQRGAGAGLTALLCTVFYLLLRELRLSRAAAGAIALLSLSLPVADSLHFWLTPEVGQLGLACCVAGLLLALRALRSPGLWAVWLHVAALVLYLVSLSIAETTLPFISLSLLLYRTRVGWRRALASWSADAILVVAAAIHYASSVPPRRTLALGSEGYLEHIHVLAANGLKLFAGTLVPFARGWTWVVVIGAVTLLLAAVAFRTLRTAELPPQLADQRRWLIAGVLGATLAAVSYVIYIPANGVYQPLAPGSGNRVNIGVLLPLSVLTFAVLRLLAGVIRRPRWSQVLCTVLFLVVLVASVQRLLVDRALWDGAAKWQRTVLASVHRLLPSPRPGTSLLLFGAPGVVTRFAEVGTISYNESAPVFSTWWELDAAVKLSYGRADLDAYPVWSYQAPQLLCGRAYVYQLGLDGVRHALAYGHVYVIDAGGAHAVELTGSAQCTRLLTTAHALRYDLAQ